MKGTKIAIICEHISNCREICYNSKKGQKLQSGGIRVKAFYETRNEPYYIGAMTDYPFPLHVHEIVELVVILKGGCTMQLDGETYTLAPGDAAIAFPLTPHSFDAIRPGNLGFAAFFPADTIGEYAAVFRSQLPDVPVLRGVGKDEETARVIRRLMAIPQGEESAYRLAYLHLLLAHILSGLSFHQAADCREKSLGARCIRYVYDHACEDISVSTTARALGISESHLSHLFAQQFRINFRRFVNAIRIDRATVMMHDPDMTLTRISDRCGFENIRTFRRAFVRETGVLPAAYMRAARSGK